MIKLNGAAQREFHFDADADTAMQYFGVLSQVIYYLPHIELIEEYSPSQVRVRLLNARARRLYDQHHYRSGVSGR